MTMCVCVCVCVCSWWFIDTAARWDVQFNKLNLSDASGGFHSESEPFIEQSDHLNISDKLINSSKNTCAGGARTPVVSTTLSHVSLGLSVYSMDLLCVLDLLHVMGVFVVMSLTNSSQLIRPSPLTFTSRITLLTSWWVISSPRRAIEWMSSVAEMKPSPSSSNTRKDCAISSSVMAWSCKD